MRRTYDRAGYGWMGAVGHCLMPAHGRQARRRRQHVLAVIQHHQQLTAGQFAHQAGGRRGRIPFGHPQGLRDAGRDQGRIGERGQLDQPGTIVKTRPHQTRRLRTPLTVLAGTTFL